jgi:hypothetical protein
VSGPVLTDCAPGPVFSGIEGTGSSFYFLSSRTRFRRYRGYQVPFSCFVLPNSFSAVPWGPGPVLCFALSNSFWAMPRAPNLVFIFCALRLVFGGSEGVGSRFHVLRFPNSFLAVPRVSGPVFMFYAHEPVFDGSEGGMSRFHV